MAQVKQVMQPLLERNTDLTLVGRLVAIKPVRHILRGISIGRSLATNLFVPSWAVIFLFEPRVNFPLNWGGRVYGPGAWDLIEHDDLPNMMRDAVEKEALPLLRPIQTIDDLVEFASEERFPNTYLNLYEHRKIFVDVARGDLDSAHSICEYMATERAKRRYLPNMREEYDRIAKELCPLIAADDRPGLARLLHKYEEGSVRAMKLEKYWEPTPFPIELES
ncbi:MAG TPA: hypothetical protein VFB68_05440 [Xanthobacteraceae bacterium]|nr:hypothetical protein [Xanthobacteraceae bacterium]